MNAQLAIRAVDQRVNLVDAHRITLQHTPFGPHLSDNLLPRNKVVQLAVKQLEQLILLLGQRNFILVHLHGLQMIL